MCELRIENRRERDLRSYEVIKQLQIKPRNNSEAPTGSNPWPPRYWCDALPTEVWSLARSRSGASSIYTRYMKRMMWSVYHKDHMSELWIENRSERDLRSCEVTWAKLSTVVTHLDLLARCLCCCVGWEEEHWRLCFRRPGSHVLFPVLMLMLGSYVWASLVRFVKFNNETRGVLTQSQEPGAHV